MSTVLLTGMTASQASQSANEKSRQFADVLHLTLRTAGHEVIWADPDIHWTAQQIDDKFDAVLVGMAPLTGLPANRVYGALSIVEKMYFSDKLFFFIDAPDAKQITDSLASVARGSSDLFKSFYSYRKFYADVQVGQERERIEAAVSRLSTSPWPISIYPSLPWEQKPLEIGMKEQVGLPMPINLDSLSLTPTQQYVSEREEIWAIDSYRTKWAISTARGLKFPTTPMRVSKGSTDRDVNEIMDAAVGSLISPQKSGGTWWSNRYIQAMNARSPIATEWRESSRIGDAWNHLPAAIEVLSHKERLELSDAQKNQYLSAVPSFDSAIFELESLLGVNR